MSFATWWDSYCWKLDKSDHAIAEDAWNAAVAETWKEADKALPTTQLYAYPNPANEWKYLLAVDPTEWDRWWHGRKVPDGGSIRDHH